MNLLYPIEALGIKARYLLTYLGKLVRLAGHFFREFFVRPFWSKEIIEQCQQIGISSMPIAAVTMLFVGLVFAFQFGITLRTMGAVPYIGKVTSLSIVRELGPVFTSMVVGGRVGAGMAAELGSMLVSEQIDAIRALGASPYKKLLVPRVAAATIMLPIVCLIAGLIGIFGAMIIAYFEFKLSPSAFYHSSIATVRMWDFVSGFLKPIFFGFAIALVGCHNGFECRMGTAGVGQATTKAVVQVSLMIVLLDFFLTRIFEMLRP